LPNSAALRTATPQATPGLLPATFLERGVSVPFTTPYLLGARLRPAARGTAELIVANASGGAGVYITSWDGVQSLCSPSVHDRRLNGKFNSLPGISPNAMRRAALDVAAEGLAGRDAAAAAKGARAQDDGERAKLNVELQLDVIRAVEQRERDWRPPVLADGAAVGWRARQALDVLAPHIGRPVDALFEIIEDIAAVFRDIGVDRPGSDARWPRLIDEVQALPDEMGEWPYSRGEDGTLDTMQVHQATELAVALARATLGQARALLDDLPRLIRRWAADKEEIRVLAARPGWVLDGWERLCLLWQVSDSTFGRPLALREVVNMLPMMPREAADWTGLDVESRSEALLRRRRTTQGEDWRTGVTQADLIARNERLRALSPGGPA
jgi:hypothetical protein